MFVGVQGVIYLIKQARLVYQNNEQNIQYCYNEYTSLTK